MFEFHGGDPRVFFFSSFRSSPLDKVLKLAFVSSVKLGVKDFRDLIFGLALDVDQRQRWLDVVGDGIWS